MIEGVADILRREQGFKPNEYGAYNWREEAIRAFGLQENDKHHGYNLHYSYSSVTKELNGSASA